MSIIEVPTLPFRAGRHLAAWVKWHTVGVYWIDDADSAPQKRAPQRRRRSAA